VGLGGETSPDKWGRLHSVHGLDDGVMIFRPTWWGLGRLVFAQHVKGFWAGGRCLSQQDAAFIPVGLTARSEREEQCLVVRPPQVKSLKQKPPNGGPCASHKGPHLLAGCGCGQAVLAGLPVGP